MRIYALLTILLLITTVTFAQAGGGGPAFSESDLENLIELQKKNFGIIKKCSVEFFIPPDPEKRVLKVDIQGLEDGLCKVILTTNGGEATYLLPEDVYTKFSDIKDLTKGKCSGMCAYSESAMGAPPTDDPEELCVRECNQKDCDLTSLECEKQNRDKCEDECGMEKGPDLSEMDEEQRCIAECVNKVDPSVICGSSKGGETGNELCQRCAAECVYLYAGPCLNDEEITEKERACETCEHCYGGPVMGDSGEGYDCIIDILCDDASDEFGDDPGTGPDSFEPGHEPSADNVLWSDYEATLNVGIVGGELLIESNQLEEDIVIAIVASEGITLEQHGETLVIENQEETFEVENHIDDLILFQDGTKRDIDSVQVKIEENKPIYEYDEREEVKLLGIIPIDQETTKKVDAENMHLLEEDKPWWSVLAITPEGPDNCGDGICGSLTHVETAFTCPADCALDASEEGQELLLTEEEKEKLPEIEYEEECPLEYYTLKYSEKIPKEAGLTKPSEFVGIIDCDIIDQRGYEKAVLAEAQEYFNTISGAYNQMNEELNQAKKDVEYAKKMIDECIGTHEYGGIDLKIPKIPTAGASPAIANYYTTDMMISGNSKALHHLAEASNDELVYFDIDMQYLQDDLNAVMEMCEGGLCLPQYHKDALKQTLDVDIINLEGSVSMWYGFSTNALSYYSKIEAKLNKMKNNPELCEDGDTEGSQFTSTRKELAQSTSTEYNNVPLIGDD